MPFVTEYETDGARLVLSGDVTVAEAAALHAALIELDGATDSVTVDETRVTGFDVSLLQLLLAFASSRHAAGRGLVVTDGPIAQRLAALGLG